MFFLHSTVRAQCPDSTGPAPNPDSLTWNAREIWGNAPCGLPIYVYVCERWWFDSTTNRPTFQLWIDSVQVGDDDADSACFNSLTPQEIIYEADSIAYQSLKQPSPYQGWCSDGYYTWNMEGYLPACWVQRTYNDRAGLQKGANPLSGIPTVRATYSFCSPMNAYCLTVCQLCFTDPNQFTGSLPVFSNCSTTSFGDPECQTNAMKWVDGTCYSLGCNFHAPGGFIEPMGVTSPAEIDEGLSVYPNPAEQNLTITSLRGGEYIRVLDVLGREALHGVISASGSLVLNIGALSPGTYYINGGHKDVKFVKR